MQYVPPLRVLSCLGEITQTESTVTLPLEAVRPLLRAAYSGPAFDPVWYAATYPDVATAIAQGIVADELSHFVQFGYFEGRRPRSFDVDTRWYEDHYEDVTEAIRAGAVSDARSHYNANGYFEPRAPDPRSATLYASILSLAAGRMAGAPTHRAVSGSGLPPLSDSGSSPRSKRGRG